MTVMLVLLCRHTNDPTPTLYVIRTTSQLKDDSVKWVDSLISLHQQHQ